MYQIGDLVGIKTVKGVVLEVTNLTDDPHNYRAVLRLQQPDDHVAFWADRLDT